MKRAPYAYPRSQYCWRRGSNHPRRAWRPWWRRRRRRPWRPPCRGVGAAPAADTPCAAKRRRRDFIAPRPRSARDADCTGTAVAQRCRARAGRRVKSSANGFSVAVLIPNKKERGTKNAALLNAALPWTAAVRRTTQPFRAVRCGTDCHGLLETHHIALVSVLR